MADAWTNQVGNNYCPQFHLGFWVASDGGNTANIEWYLDFVGHGYAIYGAQAKYTEAYIDGQRVYSGNVAVANTTGTKRISQGTITVSKSQSGRSVGASVACNLNVTWNNTWTGTVSGSSSVGIGAIQSHTVSYNANGGSGAPGSQTKWYGTILTLSSQRPSRTGYQFQGWATSSGGGVAYQPGAQYGADANVTLYAVWKANTFTVTYNANGGTGAPAAQTKTYDVTLTLSSTKPTKTNYNFIGWATSANSTIIAYAAGANYTSNSAITLYAVWELAYTYPRIRNIQANRCNSDGTLNDDGVYAKAIFDWDTDKTVSGITIVCNGVTTNVTGSGTSGSVTQIVGAGKLDTQKTYSMDVTVKDSLGSTSLSMTVAPSRYIMDVAPNGSIAFGGVADSTNVEFTNNLVTRIKYPTYVMRSEGSSGVAGYVRILTMSAIFDFNKTPITLYITQYNQIMSQVHFILIENSDGTVGIGQAYTIGPAKIYYKCIGTTCDIWCAKSDKNDAINLANIIYDPYSLPVVFDYASSFASSLSGYTQIPNAYGVNSSNRLEFTNHTALANDIALTAKTNAGSEVSLLKMNSSNQVELNWTSGGLKGRVAKQIWSGSLSVGGTITVPDILYYNIIGIRHVSDGIVTIGARCGSVASSEFHCESTTGTSASYAFSLLVNNTTVKFRSSNHGPIGTIYGYL